MGNNQDIMHRFVQQEIGRYFSSSEGWTIYPELRGRGYDAIQSAQRFRNGKLESVKILVTFSKEIPANLIEELKKPVKADAMRAVPLFAVLAPAGADLSGIPENFRKLEMQAFAFEKDELVWLKKPVQKTIPPVVKNSA